MTKEELINEFLKQQIKPKSNVEIILKGNGKLIGTLTDAKVKGPDKDSIYHLIGLVLTPPKGMLMSKAPHSVSVEMIESVKKI
ncbi:hypothetical protein [Flavobacterium sp.]|jgi:hypothetical protein|uniref:hypothetical protein n=1 Tax=Flavobacterium sp. TaxID=239 RepID=UPI002A8223A2|nr:hypothetical protein [Flavobacterium sp.]